MDYLSGVQYMVKPNSYQSFVRNVKFLTDLQIKRHHRLKVDPTPLRSLVYVKWNGVL